MSVVSPGGLRVYGVHIVPCVGGRGVTCPSAWRQGLDQRGYIWETKRKGRHLSVCVETRARTEGIYMGDKEEGASPVCLRGDKG